jgi:hypothetical protein
MPVAVPAGVDEKLFRVGEEFMHFAHDLWGTYLDALGGLRCSRDQVIEFQRKKIAEIASTEPEHASEQFMDTQPLTHEFESTASTPQEFLHRSTQGEFKARTAADGSDARVLGYMMIALLYGAWEDEYRSRFATALGHGSKNDVKSDLFGDVAQLRHAIVHHGGIATEEVERALILKWFRRGELIFITSAQVNWLYHEIDSYITTLCGIPPDAVFKV